MEETTFIANLVLKSSTNSSEEIIWSCSGATIGKIAKEFDTVRWDCDYLGDSPEAHLSLKSRFYHYSHAVTGKDGITSFPGDNVKLNREYLQKLCMFLKNNGYNVSKKFEETEIIFDITFKVEDKDMLKNTLSSYQLQN